MNGPGSLQGKARQLQLPGASEPCLVKACQNLGVRRTGFPTKPLYSLTVLKGVQSQENGPNPGKVLSSPKARFFLLPNSPGNASLGTWKVYYPRDPDS